MKTQSNKRTISGKEATRSKPDEDIEQLEKDPAVERGERLHTGKTIARGGKSKGHVRGATVQSKSTQTRSK